MKFAPVIIPTLNRPIHLKRCLDSLAKNTYAKETELYISVDYPPSEKYVSGYKDVIQLLENYDFSKFLCCHIFHQKENLGPNNNFRFLTELVSSKYDFYITTEDDNEFSPNFLEYTNSCLNYFKDSDDVIAICGDKDTEWFCSQEEEIVKVKLYVPYGVGKWVNKSSRLKSECTELLLSKKTWTIRNFFMLYKRNQILFAMYVIGILCSDKGFFWKKDGTLYLCDSVMSIYMHLSDKVCISPVIAKARTFGNDGSGVNMKLKSDNGIKAIDKRSSFVISVEKSIPFDSKNYKIGNSYLGGRYLSKTSIHAWLNLILFYLLLKNRKAVVQVFNFFRRR